jgi:hypothetical protein
MAKLGLVDIAPEFLQKMSDCLKHKQQYNMEAAACGSSYESEAV